MLQLSKRFGRWVRTATSFLLPTKVRRALKRISNTVKGQFEVERKYSISNDEFRDLPEILRSHGFRFAGQVYMTDTFVPPEKEGDMIRVRRETEDDKTRVLLTRKTWVDVQGNRERNEDEKRIDELVAQTILELGIRLTGGAPLLSFSKERDSYTRTTDDGQKVTVTLDTVEDLGQYSGHYMEIEIIVPVGTSVEPARKQIAELVKTLTGEDRECVQLSYQEMLKLSLA